MKLTLSVRSFQVPDTPSTRAWPPRMPSVPTSRATRVTSVANELSCSIILLMVLAVRRNSPCRSRLSISSAMVFVRSPCANAPITRATSVVGWTRSSMSALIFMMESDQNPLTLPREARWRSLPSRPTTWLRRSSSRAVRTLSSTTSLNASAIRPAWPGHSSGRRTSLLPRLSAIRAARIALVSPFSASPGCSRLFRGVAARVLATEVLGRRGDLRDAGGLLNKSMVFSWGRSLSSTGDASSWERVRLLRSYIDREVATETVSSAIPQPP